ncbi:MAG: acyl carrier protein [Actinobacteria bacterium]|nr:acyl carrier protein [Actinomycetota bacterium]
MPPTRLGAPLSKEFPVSDEQFEQFKACAVEVLAVSADQVTMEARFGDDLDADSLDLVELVMKLEEVFDVTVDESELENIETVGQAYNLVISKK